MVLDMTSCFSMSILLPILLHRDWSFTTCKLHNFEVVIHLIISFFFFSAFTDKGKFLLAARRYRHGAHTGFIVSLDADDLSQGSNAYVGKLR